MQLVRWCGTHLQLLHIVIPLSVSHLGHSLSLGLKLTLMLLFTLSLIQMQSSTLIILRKLMSFEISTTEKFVFAFFTLELHNKSTVIFNIIVYFEKM